MKKISLILLLLSINISAYSASCPSAYKIDRLGADGGYVFFSIDAGSSLDVSDVNFYINTSLYPDLADMAKLAYSMNHYVKFHFNGANNCNDNQMEDHVDSDEKELLVYKLELYGVNG
ncbi:hypothetical protein [Bacterioplanoides sp.]|uniref:hypothetical protein n=1 Tax=Bacterioplanoides sp. TaxID=2066072 RepID=UPI003B5AF2A8